MKNLGFVRLGSGNLWRDRAGGSGEQISLPTMYSPLV